MDMVMTPPVAAVIEQAPARAVKPLVLRSVERPRDSRNAAGDYAPRQDVPLAAALEAVKPDATWTVQVRDGALADKAVSWQRAIGLADVLSQIQMSHGDVIVYADPAHKRIIAERPLAATAAVGGEGESEALPAALQAWSFPDNTTMQAVLRDWSAKADSKVVFETGDDFSLPYRGTLYGPFFSDDDAKQPGVVTQLLRTISSVGDKRLFGCFMANNVVVVKETPCPEDSE